MTEDVSKKIRETYQNEKLEELKEKTQVKSVGDEFGKVLEKAQNMSQKEKDKLVDNMYRLAEEQGRLCLERAFMEGDMTENEWLYMRDELGMSQADMSNPLMVFFANRDNEEDHVLVTKEGGKCHENKKYLENKFNIKIMTETEAEEYLMNKEEEEDKNESQ